MIGLRDRAHLLQEEVSLKMPDQTNRLQTGQWRHKLKASAKVGELPPT